MAQGIFSSMRNLYHHKTRHINPNDAVGEIYKKHTIGDYGSVPEPSCLEYDQYCNMIAIGNKKGIIKIFGKPGLCFSNVEEDAEEIVEIKFIPETNFIISLSISSKLSLWYLCKTTNSLVKIDEITSLRQLFIDISVPPPDFDPHYRQVVTAVEVIEKVSSIMLGDVHGSIVQIKLNLEKMKTIKDQNYQKFDSTLWVKPSQRNALSVLRILSKFPIGTQRNNDSSSIGQVIHISLRPGSSGQILIGYQSNVCVLYNLETDSIGCILSEFSYFTGIDWLPSQPIIRDRLLINPYSDNSFTNGTRPTYHLNYKLVSCHANGSIIHWTIPNESDGGQFAVKNSNVSPFEDDHPCYPIKFIKACRSKDDSTLIIFSGGLPKPDYLSKSSLSIIVSQQNTVYTSSKYSDIKYPKVFELTSEIVDVQILEDVESLCGNYLAVLTEEEFLLIDISQSVGNDIWPIIKQQPYLICLHNAPITAYHFVTKVTSKWLQQIIDMDSDRMKKKQQQPMKLEEMENYSNWPIKGEPIGSEKRKIHKFDSVSNDKEKFNWSNVWLNDVLITGHGDGSIVFWRLGKAGCVCRLAKIKSSYLFVGLDQAEECDGVNYDSNNNLMNLDYGDIPMKRVGVFDPCADDNRLSIQFIHFTGPYLVVGGCAGQIILWSFSKYQTNSIKHVEVDLVTHLKNFKWQGFQKLELRDLSSIKTNPVFHDPIKTNQTIFQPIMIVSIWPPSQITALDLCIFAAKKSVVLISAGTLHGVTMVSYIEDEEPVTLMSHCTVPEWSKGATQESAMGEGWTRRRTRDLKKSLRESFRKLRRRSTKRAEGVRHGPAIRSNMPENKSVVRVEVIENPAIEQFEERLIEDRPTETADVGIIKSIRIHISNNLHHSSSNTSGYTIHLFAGTLGGRLLWFQAPRPIVDSDQKITASSLVNLRPIKEYQLQHRAPIQFLALLNTEGLMYSSRQEVSKGRFNQLLLVTEEQVRIYELPSFKLRYKLRVTAADGYRLKTGSTVTLNKANTRNGTEHMLCSTNSGGQLIFLSTINLKKKDIVKFVDKSELDALTTISLSVCCQLETESNTEQGDCHGSGGTYNEEASLQPYGVYYSGHGQVTLFKIIPK